MSVSAPTDHDITLRDFAWRDVEEITAIYAHYVANSVATFDLEAPGEAFMAEKFGHMAELGHPLVIAEMDGQIAGYAYASTYRPRPAYRFTCEDTVYLRPDLVGRGLGGLLLAETIRRASAFGFRQMLAVIADEVGASVRVHEKQGFRVIGRYPELGFKFDRWVGIVHMQRAL